MCYISKIKNIISEHRYFTLLLLIFSLHLAFNLQWLKIEYVPVADPASNLFLSMKFYYNPGFETLKQFMDPPLLILSSIPFYFVLGKSINSAVLVNSFYLFSLLISVYGIGKKIYNEKIGLFASILLSFYPAIYWFSRMFWNDLAVAAMISLSVYLLISSEYFKKRRYSILFGISLGLASLAKQTFIIFLIPFLLYALFKTDLERWHTKVNILISLVIAVSIGSIWYLPDLHTSLGRYLPTLFSSGSYIPQSNYLLQPFTYVFYLSALVKEMSIPYLGIFMVSTVSVVYYLKEGGVKEEILVLLVTVFFAYLVFSIHPPKDLRYIIPVLPLVALITAFPIYKMRNDLTRAVLILIIISAGIFNFAHQWETRDFISERPYSVGFEVNKEEVVSVIDHLEGEKISMAVLPLEFAPSFKYYATLEGLSLELHENRIYYSEKPIYPFIKEMDYVLVSEYSPSWPPSQKKKKEFEDTLQKIRKSENFTIVEKFNLTEKITAKLYKIKN